MTDGREPAGLPHGAAVTAVAFGPDGRLVTTASADRMARVWLFRPENLVDLACARQTRNLTPEERRQHLGNVPYGQTCPDLASE